MDRKPPGQIFGPPSPPPWDVEMLTLPVDEACTSMIQMSNESVQQHIQVWVPDGAFNGQISLRPKSHHQSFGPPKMVVVNSKGNPRNFQRNLGW